MTHRPTTVLLVPTSPEVDALLFWKGLLGSAPAHVVLGGTKLPDGEEPRWLLPRDATWTSVHQGGTRRALPLQWRGVAQPDCVHRASLALAYHLHLLKPTEHRVLRSPSFKFRHLKGTAARRTVPGAMHLGDWTLTFQGVDAAGWTEHEHTWRRSLWAHPADAYSWCEALARVCEVSGLGRCWAGDTPADAGSAAVGGEAVPRSTPPSDQGRSDGPV